MLVHVLEDLGVLEILLIKKSFCGILQFRP